MSEMEFSRRGFIGGAAAFFVAGCRSGGWLAGTPRLRFGVVSDIHLTTPASCAMTERAFRYFRARGADAVMMGIEEQPRIREGDVGRCFRRD